MLAGRQVITGRANAGAQSLACASVRGQQWVVYSSGQRVNVLSGAFELLGQLNAASDAECPGATADAVAISDETGAVAVSCGSLILVYVRDGAWRLEAKRDMGYHVTALAWSPRGELAVGGERLALVDIRDGKANELVSKAVATPIVELAYAPGGRFLAARGRGERLIKVWTTVMRADALALDFVYLPHPRAVASVSWRRRHQRSSREAVQADGQGGGGTAHGARAVLLTWCSDGVTRFWASSLRGGRMSFHLLSVMDPTQFAGVLPEGCRDCMVHWLDNVQVFAALLRRGDAEAQYLGETGSNGGDDGDVAVASDRTFRSVTEHLSKVLTATPDLVFHVADDGSLVLWSLQDVASGGSGEAAASMQAPPVLLILRQPHALQRGDAAYFRGGRVCVYADTASAAMQGRTTPALFPPEVALVAANADGALRLYQLSLEELFGGASSRHERRGAPAPSVRLCRAQSGHQGAVRQVQQHVSEPLVVTVADGGSVALWHVGTSQMRVREVHDLDLVQYIRVPGAERACWLPLVGSEACMFLVASEHGSMEGFGVLKALSGTRRVERLGFSVEFAGLLALLHAYVEDGRAYVVGVTRGQADGAAEGYIWTVCSQSGRIELLGRGLLSRSDGSGLVLAAASATDDVCAAFAPAGMPSAHLFVTVDVDGDATLWHVGQGSFQALRQDDPAPFVAVARFSLAAGPETTPVIVQTDPFGKMAVVLRGSSETDRVESDRVEVWGSAAAGLEMVREAALDSLKGRVRGVAWHFSSDAQHLLAIATDECVQVHCAQRPAPGVAVRWRRLATLAVPDAYGVAWLATGGLVVLVDARVVVFDRWNAPVPGPATLPADTRAFNEFLGPNWVTLAAAYNGRLPDHHPELLRHYLLWGQFELVWYTLRLVARFLSTMAAHGQEVVGVPMPLLASRVFSGTSEAFHGETSLGLFDTQDQDQSTGFSGTEEEALPQNLDGRPATANVLSYYARYLAGAAESLPGLLPNDQANLAVLVEIVAEIPSLQQGLDLNGLRYAVGVRLHEAQRQRQSPDAQVPLRMAEVAFAANSESQAVLIEKVVQLRARPTWADLRAWGVGWWLQSDAALVRLVETAARNQYLGESAADGSEVGRDPVRCTLLYLALRRRAVVARLWDAAHGHADQMAMTGFLKRNFDEERTRVAAAKNAYVLLSKQRYELAVAFFLLADRVRDAASVCVSHMADVQLALVLCRLYDSSGEAESALLRGTVLSAAAAADDRWTAALAYQRLGRPNLALCSLVLYPDVLKQLVEVDDGGELTDALVARVRAAADSDASAVHSPLRDPELLILYRGLCERFQAQRRGALVDALAGSIAERVFVLACAAAYEERGLPALALDVIRSGSSLDSGGDLGLVEDPNGQEVDEEAKQPPKDAAEPAKGGDRAQDIDWSFDSTPAPAGGLEDELEQFMRAQRAENAASDQFDEEPTENPAAKSPVALQTHQKPARRKTTLRDQLVERNFALYQWTLVMRIVQAVLRSSELVSPHRDLLEPSALFQNYFERLREGLLELGEQTRMPPAVLDRIIGARALQASKLVGYLELMPLATGGNAEEARAQLVALQLETSNTLCRLVLAPNVGAPTLQNAAVLGRSLLWSLVRAPMVDEARGFVRVGVPHAAVIQCGLAAWFTLVVCRVRLGQAALALRLFEQANVLMTGVLGGRVQELVAPVRRMLKRHAAAGQSPEADAGDGSELSDDGVGAGVRAADLFLGMMAIQQLILRANALPAQLDALGAVDEPAALDNVRVFVLDAILKQLTLVHVAFEQSLEELWPQTSFDGVDSIRDALASDARRALWDHLVGLPNPFDVYSRLLSKLTPPSA